MGHQDLHRGCQSSSIWDLFSEFSCVPHHIISVWHFFHIHILGLREGWPWGCLLGSISVSRSPRMLYRTTCRHNSDKNDRNNMSTIWHSNLSAPVGWLGVHDFSRSPHMMYTKISESSFPNFPISPFPIRQFDNTTRKERGTKWDTSFPLFFQWIRILLHHRSLGKWSCVSITWCFVITDPSSTLSSAFYIWTEPLGNCELGCRDGRCNWCTGVVGGGNRGPPDCTCGRVPPGLFCICRHNKFQVYKNPGLWRIDNSMRRVTPTV
jgi:hypothetical protein